MKKVIDVVGAVLIRDGKVLAAQRSAKMSLPLMWEFPGGKIETDESPVDALKRELLEELKVSAKVGDHVETTSYEYDFGIVTLQTYYCTVENGVPELTEHAEIRWLAPEKLLTLEWAPADIPAVEKIMAELV